jgi:peptide chain release factor subunit 1
VAVTITWDLVRELAAFRAARGCAVSLYLDLDPSVTPTAGDVQSRIRALLDDAERRLNGGRASLGHEARVGLKADLERIDDWFRTEFDRGGKRGLALFADGLDNFWATVDAADPLPDDVRIDRRLYLAPLMPHVGRGDGALVAFVGRERGQVYRLRGGRLEEIADETDDVPGRHDQGGWSQSRYERHIETIVDRHLRRVAGTLDRCVRSLRGVRIVLVGSEEVRPELEAMLAHETRACVLGWTTAEAHADSSALLDAARPLLDEWWARQEAEPLDRWREKAAKKGRAATGWEETLEAASDGRVDLLLVQHGADHPAYECPACGRAQLTDGNCPLDGTRMESRDAGLDVAVHKTLLNGGTVKVIRERHDLEPVGGVAALLRF